MLVKIVKEKIIKKNENKNFESTKCESRNMSTKKVWVKIWVKHVTLQNYESKKCCF